MQIEHTYPGFKNEKLIYKLLLFLNSQCIINTYCKLISSKIKQSNVSLPLTPIVINNITIIKISPFVKSHLFHLIFFFIIFLLTQQDGHGLHPFAKTIVDLFLLLMCFQYLLGCIVWRTICFSSLIPVIWMNPFLKIGWPYFHCNDLTLN